MITDSRADRIFLGGTILTMDEARFRSSVAATATPPST
jgi:hypothetical protein